MNIPQLYGGIEAGGTKFVCVVGNAPDHIVDEIRFPTTTPGETLGKTIQFFQPFVSSGQISVFGGMGYPSITSSVTASRANKYAAG